MTKGIVIPEHIAKKYLEDMEGKSLTVLEYKKLGSGWHGTGYSITYKVKGQNKPKKVVIRTLNPVSFSHEFLSDRAKVFVTQQEMSKNIPGHIKCFDVIGYTADHKLVSVGDPVEFFQAVEFVSGSNYSADFQRIKISGKLESGDIKKAKMLGMYLAKLHKKTIKTDKDTLRALRRRILRDTLGHGEMMLGVIDSYPDGFKFITQKGLNDLICKTAVLREEIKDTPYLPCRIHGDFHPGNIMFEHGKVRLLDSSRFPWGDAADDVIALGINYVWFAVMQTGSFKGVFKELFYAFWNAYMDATGHRTISITAPIHMSFRGVVVAHPFFYSDQTDETRSKMMKLVATCLDKKTFGPKLIEECLK